MDWAWWRDFAVVYGVSAGLGACLTYSISKGLFDRIAATVSSDPDDGNIQRTPWMTALVGIVERTIITTCVIWLPSATIPFIGGWTALKVAGGWGLLKNGTHRNRAAYFAGLLGNVASYAVAIGAGLKASPESLALLSK